MKVKKPDFSGYATRNDVLCSDGRTIRGGAFKHQDGERVQLAWEHRKDTPENILGHAILENRKDGVYAYAYFNETPMAAHAKELVRHGDIEALSIYANKLTQSNGDVIHGNIREVSLVLVGANPGAYIENVNIAHGDGFIESETEAVIHHGFSGGLELEHNEGDSVATGKTVKDVVDAMSEEQKNVLYFLIAEAQKGGSSAKHSDSDEDDEDYEEDEEEYDEEEDEEYDEDEEDFDDEDEDELDHSEGGGMSRNVFKKYGGTRGAQQKAELSHSQLEAIQNDARRVGSYKEAFLAHAGEYGIGNIDMLFPDAKSIRNAPDLVKRQTEWVKVVISGTTHQPFSRIKSRFADLTHDDARAKGYIKGTLKKEEFFSLAGRVTTPTTVYKKQKLDRDDIIDIVDLDVVVFLKGEMRIMLDEEIAGAILIGDGREVGDPDKIKDPVGSTEGSGIRSIANDHDLYAHQLTIPPHISGEGLLDALIRSRKHWKGTGSPAFFTSDSIITDLLLLRDKQGRKLYRTVEDLAAELRVSRLVAVDDDVLARKENLLGILTNLSDYSTGTDKGGNISMFDDFDIDYNQHKYLMEARMSGALTLPKSALVVLRGTGERVSPVEPTQDGNTVTIPTTTGVEYSINSVVVTGEQTITEDTWVDADPEEGYYFPNNITRRWSFLFDADAV